jgi:serine/threonine-protein kinase HipA
MSLAVHLHGARIGTLGQSTGTDYTFEYTPQVVAEAGQGAIVLSHSLPVREESYGAIETRTFFEGLLPEHSRRDELARELRLDSNDSYALLAAIGRDCAGAIVVVPDEDGPNLSDGPVEWLADGELSDLVDELPRRPLGISRRGQKMRLSLAGVQRKLVLVRSGSGRFGVPTADTPSTHLIKPEYEHEYPNLAHNEMFCMSVARCLGLPAAETELISIGERPCLVSRRFDRSTEGSETVRLHQEDLCQALAVPSNLKYQSQLGPGFARFRGLLGEIGRGADVRTMVRAAVMNFVLGNSDAHGKNFAILFAEMGRELAPLYDVVSTAVYPLDDEMAMAIGDNFDPESVALTDWLDMSNDCDLAPAPFFSLVRDTAADVEECARSVAGLAQAEKWHVPLIDQIVAVAERRAARIASELVP